jgi:hypothetical protein
MSSLARGKKAGNGRNDSDDIPTRDPPNACSLAREKKSATAAIIAMTLPREALTKRELTRA